MNARLSPAFHTPCTARVSTWTGRLFAIAVLLVIAGLATGCGRGRGFVKTAKVNNGKSAAIVSLAVNDFGGALQGWNTARTGDLMARHTAQMVGLTAKRLSKHFKMVDPTTYVGKAEYQKLAGPAREVAVPKIGGSVMPIMAESRSDMVKARLSPAKAAALAQATGAQVLIVLYAEWGVRTGGFVPTSKALSKTVMAIYDATGRQLYMGRRDIVGRKRLGAFGSVVVDKNSIVEWVDAYDRAVGVLMSR